ncbi:hypothetical protein HK105_200680 [Polyrhizophydium stewartii]|uniref:Protein MEMO1 n=1 Tax=Polyrhizophydium stewartii TaxID=2732419 RepID=A0ABR4NJP1_9FUNG|nr:hypothetical protein HK105_007181 [Polyrhizophydium stewartii]
MATRRATHAGSWYSASGAELDRQLDGWLEDAAQGVHNNPAVRAVIAPDRVFILGPSHHVYLRGCALSACTQYETPLGPLHIDQAVVGTLAATGLFETMSRRTDEDEHSIEMHLPYIFKVMSRKNGPFTIVPILVGATSPSQEQTFGRLLAPYLADPTNLFVVSSDFCHWGRRFDFTLRIDPTLPIHESIERLDREGMSLIEGRNPAPFEAYLKRTRNTICGRHPIGVLLNAVDAISKASGRSSPPAANSNAVADAAGGLVVAAGDGEIEIRFVHYSQSSKVTSERESSVSYASAFVAIPPSIAAAALSS